jgi:hypothetical protein
MHDSVITGVGTDGEFHTLRTRGDTRSLHGYQLIHDARKCVQKMSVRTLTNMLTISVGKYIVMFLNRNKVPNFLDESFYP